MSASDEKEVETGIEIGKWDYSIAVLGSKGYGKTTLGLTLARELAGAPAYVIAHDPTRSIHGQDVHRHRSKDALFAALGSDDPSGIHVLDVEDGLEVVDAALVVAQHSRGARGIWEEGSRRVAVPVLVVLDEVVCVDEMGPSHLSPTLKKASSLARHLHLGMIWHTQRPAQVHPWMWDTTTKIFLLRTKPRWHPALESAGISKALLEQSRKLAKHHYVVYPDDDPEENA